MLKATQKIYGQVGMKTQALQFPLQHAPSLVPRRGEKPGQETASAAHQPWNRHMSLLPSYFSLVDPQLDVGQP